MATEAIEQALSRLNEHYSVDFEGIAFGMQDQNGIAVKCLVTYQAITVRMGGVPRLAQRVKWFRRNRREVESIASEKFASGEFSEFPIRVETKNLNPDQFAQS
jgi:hypothetical protein